MKNLAHDSCLRFVDLDEPADALAVVSEPNDPLVAINTPTGGAAYENSRLHPAQGLIDQMLEMDRAEESGDSEFDLVDMALADGVELHHMERQLLAQPCDIFRVACEPAERLADDGVDVTRLHRREQALQARAVAAIPRHLWVELGPDHRAAEIGDEARARCDLIRAGGCGLHGRGVTAVKSDAARSVGQHGLLFHTFGRAGIPRPFVMASRCLSGEQPNELCQRMLRLLVFHPFDTDNGHAGVLG
ncbi:hypothetical protein [Sphingomonas trueperi]|uniref:hypothetical protein n=1 Tax=Sphingomonas trueperi TaxID=53317 RepID=UPI00347A253C